MNKFKVIIFSIVILTVIAVIIYPLMQSKNMEVKENETYPEGEYVVGKDIAAGAYDIKAIKGPIEFSGRKLSEGDNLKGLSYTNEEHIIINGDGKVILSKAEFKPLKKNEKGNYVIKHSGIYKIDEQIDKGRYTISYEVENDEKLNHKPFIQVLSKSKGDILKSFDLVDSREITLKESHSLKVNKTIFKENNNIRVILSPLN